MVRAADTSPALVTFKLNSSDFFWLSHLSLCLGRRNTILLRFRKTLFTPAATGRGGSGASGFESLCAALVCRVLAPSDLQNHTVGAGLA